jgi:hypothetical protein
LWLLVFSFFRSFVLSFFGFLVRHLPGVAGRLRRVAPWDLLHRSPGRSEAQIRDLLAEWQGAGFFLIRGSGDCATGGCGGLDQSKSVSRGPASRGLAATYFFQLPKK